MQAKTETHHPIDHGYAWFILAASMLSTFNVVGSLKLFGILYAEFIRKYKTSATAASLLQLAQPIVFSITTVFALIFGVKILTCRQVAVLGGILLLLSFSLSSIAPNIYVLIFTYSVLYGVGAAFAFTSAVVVLSLYFKERRGMANGFMMASGSLGGLGMTLLIRVLIDHYALSGALLILSAICSHIIVAGCLYRPLSFYNTKMTICKTDVKDNEINDESHFNLRKTLLSSKTDHYQWKKFSKSLFLSEPLLHKMSLVESREKKNSETNERSNIERCDQSEFTFNSHQDLNRDKHRFDKHEINVFHLGGQFHSVHSIDISFDIDDRETKTEHQKETTTRFSKYFNIAILKNRTFLRFLISYAFGSIGSQLPIYYLPILAQEQGIDVYRSDILVLVAGGTDCLGRGLSGFLSDILPVKRQYIIAFGLTLSSISQALIHLYTTYWSLIIFSMVYSFFAAVLFGIYAATLVDIVGLRNFNSAVSVMWMFQGIFLGLSSPLMGIIRDWTGTYAPCFYFFSATLMVASCFLWAEMLPCSKTDPQVTVK